MTYIESATVEKEMKILFTKTNHSGNLSDNDLITFNTTAIYNNTSNVTLNSDNVVLGEGNYLIECSVGISNANSISNYANWNILVDDTEQNTPGSSIEDGKVGVDTSIAIISVPSGSTKTVKIKVTSVGGTCSVSDDYSFLMIRQVV